MTQVNSLGIDAVIKELNLGRATVKFILARFAPFIACDPDGRTFDPKALATVIRIKDMMDDGLLPSQIEAALAGDGDLSQAPAHQAEPPHTDVRMSRDALGFIQELFQDIKGHQNRIAQAHEKRAAAEERKAVAIEKRAEAEAKKAEAMNNIAAALQEMSRQRRVDDQTMEIAGQAAQALTLNEIEAYPEDSDTGTIDIGPPDNSVDLDSELADTELEELLDHPVLGDVSGEPGDDDLDLGDLSGLLEPDDEPDDEPGTDLAPADQNLTGQDLDDLSRLIDTVSEEAAAEADLEDLLDEPPLPDLDDLTELMDVSPQDTVLPLDDLSLLVDYQENELDSGDTAALPPELDDLNLLVESEEATGDLDDLSLLVDLDGSTGANEVSADLDDLSALVDQGSQDTDVLDLDDLSQLVDAAPDNLQQDLDDLSLLVGQEDTSPKGSDTSAGNMDDLSLLVDSSASEDSLGDNLWDLVDTEPDAPAAAPMDDLSALVNDGDGGTEKAAGQPEADISVEDAPSLKPEITPEQDLEKYKAAVMKIIIELKESGASVGETTERLNRDQVPTLSGKPQWREKAIEKIYGFIDSAK